MVEKEVSKIKIITEKEEGAKEEVSKKYSRDSLDQPSEEEAEFIAKAAKATWH